MNKQEEKENKAFGKMLLPPTRRQMDKMNAVRLQGQMTLIVDPAKIKVEVEIHGDIGTRQRSRVFWFTGLDTVSTNFVVPNNDIGRKLIDACRDYLDTINVGWVEKHYTADAYQQLENERLDALIAQHNTMHNNKEKNEK